MFNYCAFIFIYKYMHIRDLYIFTSFLLCRILLLLLFMIIIGIRLAMFLCTSLFTSAVISNITKVASLSHYMINIDFHIIDIDLILDLCVYYIWQVVIIFMIHNVFCNEPMGEYMRLKLYVINSCTSMLCNFSYVARESKPYWRSKKR